MPGLHAQDAVQTQFMLAALHHKAVGVEHQDGGEDGHHDAAQRHHHLHVVGAGEAGQGVVKGQVGQDIEHGHGGDVGQQVGEVELVVAQDVGDRQVGIEGDLTHGAHHLV